MTSLRTISLLFVCFSLFIGSAASASMPCCMNMDMPNGQAEMDASAELPCHNVADTDSQNTASCDDCDCQGCIQLNAIIEQSSAKHMVASNTIVQAAKDIRAHQPEAIFQPPKQLS